MLSGQELVYHEGGSGLNEQTVKNRTVKSEIYKDWIRKGRCAHQDRVCDAMPLQSLVSQCTLRGDTGDSGKQPGKLWSRVIGGRQECATDVKGGDCVITGQEKSWSRITDRVWGWCVWFLTSEIEGQCKMGSWKYCKERICQSRFLSPSSLL